MHGASLASIKTIGLIGHGYTIRKNTPSTWLTCRCDQSRVQDITGVSTPISSQTQLIPVHQAMPELGWTAPLLSHQGNSIGQPRPL